MNDTNIDYKINLKEGDRGALKALERYNKALEESKRIFRESGELKVQQELIKLREAGVRVLEREEQRTRQIATETERLARAERERERSRVAGDLSSGLGATRALAGSLGGGGVLTDALNLGDDAFQLIEYLPRLREGLGALAGSAAAAAGGVVPLVAGLGAVGVALGAAGVAYSLFTEQIERNSQKIAAELRAQVQVNREIAQGLSTEEARKRIEEIKSVREAELADLEAFQQELNRLLNIPDGTAEFAQRTIEQLQDGLLLGGAQILGDAFNTVFQGSVGPSADRVKGLQKAIEELEVSLEASGGELRSLESALSDNRTAANDAEAAEKRLVDARQRAATVIQQLEEQQRRLTESYEQQRKILAEDRRLQDARAAESEAISLRREQFALDRQLAREGELQRRRLVEIERQSARQVEQLRAESVARQVEALEAITKTQEQFNRERVRAEERFSRDRIRAARNQAAEELDAIIENDVTALILGRRRFGRSEFDAREDFELERRERLENLAIRLQEINAELAKFQEAQAVKKREIEAQAVLEIELAKQEFSENQRLAAEERGIRRQWAEEDRQLARARLEEDRAIQDRRAAEQLSRQLADIEAKRIAEVDALSAVLRATGQVRDVAAQVAFFLNGRTGTPFNRYQAGGSTALMSMPQLPSPANMSLPATSMSQALPPPAGLSGLTVNVTGNAIGSVTTRAELEHVVNAVVGAVQAGIRQARTG